MIGALFAFLFGIFFTGPDFAGLLLYAVVGGALFGALFGALAHEAASGGRRDFVSDTSIAADRYEVQADEGVAADVAHVLAAMPAK